jgi:hypothetical protein
MCRCSRTRRTGSGSVMMAMTLSRPPHLGHPSAPSTFSLHATLSASRFFARRLPLFSSSAPLRSLNGTINGQVVSGLIENQACMEAGIAPQVTEIELPPELVEFVVPRNVPSENFIRSARRTGYFNTIPPVPPPSLYAIRSVLRTGYLTPSVATSGSVTINTGTSLIAPLASSPRRTSPRARCQRRPPRRLRGSATAAPGPMESSSSALLNCYCRNAA